MKKPPLQQSVRVPHSTPFRYLSSLGLVERQPCHISTPMNRRIASSKWQEISPPQAGTRSCMDVGSITPIFKMVAIQKLGIPIFTDYVDKAGIPRVSESCVSCHLNNGRDVPPTPGSRFPRAVVARHAAASGAAHPTMGDSLQPKDNVDFEGSFLFRVRLKTTLTRLGFNLRQQPISMVDSMLAIWTRGPSCLRLGY